MCRFCDQVSFDEVYDPQLGRGGFVPGANMAPDLILTGGTILTMDAARPEAEAVAIRQGVIQAVGSAGEVLARRGRSTRIMPLDGRALVPGFIGSGLRLPVQRDRASLDAWIEGRARAGFTTVDVTTLGAGWGEFDDLSRLIDRRHRLRLRGAADQSLRHDWRDGRLDPGHGNDLVRIDAVRLSPTSAPDTLAEALRLHAEGWGVVIDCPEAADLAALLPLAALAHGQSLKGLRIVAPQGGPEAVALRKAGFSVINPASENPVATLTGTREAVLSHLAALTRDAARQAGLSQIVGQLRPGCYADFTVLDRSPLGLDPGVPKVVGTWIEGIPVRPEADHVAA